MVRIHDRPSASLRSLHGGNPFPPWAPFFVFSQRGVSLLSMIEPTGSRRCSDRFDRRALTHLRIAADVCWVLLRLALFVVPASLLVGADVLVKAFAPTASWDFHQRSAGWSLAALVWLGGLLALAVLPSRLSATAAGVVAGGVLGNVVSALRHGGRVPNPLVVATTAFNLADVWILVGLPLLMFALARVAIHQRAVIDRFIPPRRWERALRRKLGL